MKINILCISIITIILVSFSCSSDKISQIGKWDDIIKLSTKDAKFQANADSTIITTKGDWWWITDISVDNEYFYNFEDINFESNNYSIKQNCFVVERRDKNTLFIKIDSNTLPSQRIITIGLEAGDYFDRIVITQAAQ